MARCLRVITNPGDVHAGAIEWAIADRGIETKWMCFCDFPAASTCSVAVSDEQPEMGVDDVLPDTSCDFVWIRRIGRSAGVPEELDERDRALCQMESERFFWGAVHCIAPDAWWVNPLASYMTSRNNKLHQLRVAQAAGFKVPDTLASNDPARIRRFFGSRKGRVISKPFFPHIWYGTTGGAHEYLTSLVTAEILADDRVLQASPLIYQGFVEKQYELRVSVFAQAIIAAKLRSTEDPDLTVDWRHPSKLPPVEPFQLPPGVRDSCMRVMRSLGLVHGSFDFIVTPDGDYYFLEVNESGQCLWLEEACPELPVLAALVGVFLGRSHHFSERDISKYPYKFTDFLSSQDYPAFLKRSDQNHLPISRDGVEFPE
ncbi:hypothetical protein [Enterobacter kobei]|uniref:hypothetical protein n=1 Tax=Enterobacter kobei TaxID=208224 RepID=UPI00287554BA|nr:hypothetical protein [Enterobacter kobei]MDS0025195.1 hypothetical protein [Enterobacter kobei]